MGIKIKAGKNGKLTSPYWYARFTRNGEKVDVSLKVPIRGTVPIGEDGQWSVTLSGDPAFERSRKEALKALAEMERKSKTTGKSEAVKRAEEADLVNRYYQARTGAKISSPEIANLSTLWEKLERSYTPCAERKARSFATFADFAKFARTYAMGRGNKCETVDEITEEIAKAWFEKLRTDFAWGTVREKWHLLRKAWSRWHIYAGKNPFENVVMRNREIGNAKVPHRPLTEKELANVLELTEERPDVHGLAVTAACTGMRIGDVCNLKWADVDLHGGLIDAVTAKAGVRVTLPILAPLRKVLEEREKKHAVFDSPFVFPTAAENYNHVREKDGIHDRQTGIVRMIKPYFARALLAGMKKKAEPAQIVGDERPPMTAEEIGKLVDAGRFAPAKKERLRRIAQLFKDGTPCKDIAAAIGIARGQVSDYLGELETLTGEVYRPKMAKLRQRGGLGRKELIDLTRQQREIGQLSASLYGWHSFRATFVVLAVEAGVPLADIQKIVGHGTVEVTMQYYNPTKKHVAERFRRQMAGTVLETGTAPKALVEAKADTSTAVVPTRTENGPTFDLALAVLGTEPGVATVAASVLKAAGIDPHKEPSKAIAVTLAAVPESTAKRVRAVYSAAGIALENKKVGPSI